MLSQCTVLLPCRFHHGTSTCVSVGDEQETSSDSCLFEIRRVSEAPTTTTSQKRITILRNTPSTAGNPITGSERPSPEPILKKEAPPAVLGGENSGNALEASNALNYRAWGIPAVLSREIPGNALRAFPEEIPEFFRNFFRKVPAVLGVWPKCTSKLYGSALPWHSPKGTRAEGA